MDWGILTSEALYHAEKLKDIEVRNRQKFNATSIDLRVKKLFAMRAGLKQITNKTSISDLYEEVVPGKEGWLLKSDGYYLAEAEEELHKGRGYVARICSRSTWARFGVACFPVQDELDDLCNVYEGKILFNIDTLNTSVILRPGDAPAQIRFAKEGFAPVWNPGRIKGVRNFAAGAKLAKYGLTLTLDSKIQLYTGGIIDPKEDVGRHFREIDISKGFDVDNKMFYLGASRQFVKIPSEFIGYLHLTDHTGQESGHLGPQGKVSHYVHGNAPFIDPFPRFNGKVTFENMPLFPCKIRKGMRLTELQIMPLLIPYSDTDFSRYNNQSCAQTSRRESVQLELFQ